MSIVHFNNKSIYTWIYNFNSDSPYQGLYNYITFYIKFYNSYIILNRYLTSFIFVYKDINIILSRKIL